MLKQKNIILAITGGIAAFKATALLRLLKKSGANVRVICTPHAAKFCAEIPLGVLSGHAVISDPFDSKTGEVHVELSEWADAMLVVPATANVIAKMAHGMADDIVSLTALCFDGPLLLAPAMHHVMWNKNTTQENMSKLKALGMRTVGPISGELANGKTGMGRMMEPEEILSATSQLFSSSSDNISLKGKRILITAGGTQEPIDPVRVIANRSSGKMGFALATAAQKRGASVILVAGVTPLETPSGVTRVDATTANAMAKAVFKHAKNAHGVFMAAAVSDYSIATPSPSKLKKTTRTLSLELVPTVDILKTLGASKKHFGYTLVGFALESERLAENAKAKLEKKNADWIVANLEQQRSGSVFGNDRNKALLVSKKTQRSLPEMSKADLAEAILDHVFPNKKNARHKT